jgi:MarR family 2-MHQ and catechol resistance regulon transcriptional repressor
MRAADSVRQRRDPRLLAYGLTETQFGALETILHLGPLSQREVAGKQLTSASNLTTMIDNLERDSLVTRRRDPTDRRKTTIDLTPRGRAPIRKIFPGHVEAIVQEFEVLTAAAQPDPALDGCGARRLKHLGGDLGDHVALRERLRAHAHDRGRARRHGSEDERERNGQAHGPPHAAPTDRTCSRSSAGGACGHPADGNHRPRVYAGSRACLPEQPP